MKIRLEDWLIGFNQNREPIVAIDQEGFSIALRDIRDVLLKESDWIQNSDTQISDDIKQEWLIYRQALRDFPKSLEDIVLENIVEFPEPPVQYRPRTWVNLIAEDEVHTH
jgi:hypothetical protein